MKIREYKLWVTLTPKEFAKLRTPLDLAKATVVRTLDKGDGQSMHLVSFPKPSIREAFKAYTLREGLGHAGFQFNGYK